MILSKLKIMRLHGCSMEFLSSEVTLKKLNESHILPELELFIDTDLNFTIRVCGWLLPDLQRSWKVCVFHNNVQAFMSTKLQDM